MWRRLRRNQEKGLALEKRVELLYKRLGKWNVKRDVKLIDGYGNLSQIDVTYGRFFRVYIECKNYGDKPVPLSDVAKFKEVLILNNISPSRGIFITTSTYVPRALTIGIKTIDGTQLKRLERFARVYSIIRKLIWLGIIGGASWWLYNNWTDDFLTQKHWEKQYSQWSKQAKLWYKDLKKRLGL